MMELVAKYLSGNANEEERKEVEEWRNANPEEFLSCSEAWTASGLHLFNSAAARTAVMGRIANQQKFESTNSEPGGSGKMRWLWLAATIAIVAGASYLFFSNSSSQDAIFSSPEGWLMAETGVGETKEIELPDGSVISMNESSTISYPPQFTEQRVVNISGTAFFEITPDKDRPFSVETAEAIVTVLGTSFQVRAEKASSFSEVTVETGLVSLSKKPQANVAEKAVKMNLAPGDVGVVRQGGGGVAKTKNIDPNYLSWKTRKMVFSRTPMKKVVSTLSKVYKVDIELANKEIENCRLTATFDQKSVEDVVAVISETFSFEVAASSGEFTFSGKACK